MEYVIATDGSYQEPDVIGALVVANPQTRIITKTARVKCNHEEFKKSRNVYGECAAALEAFKIMRLYLDNDPTSQFVLVYDYEGVQKWIDGQWKAKTGLTRDYLRGFYMCELSLSRIKFFHQTSHQGITDFYSYLNDTADKICSGVTRPEFIIESNLGEF